MTRSTTASGADLGYSLQRTRFLARLLEAADEDVVCLEVLDDVRVEKADGTFVSEEDKSSVRGNPIANRSVDLWKTLANWINAALGQLINPEACVFEIYISKPSGGSFSDALRDANTIADARIAIEKIRNELWGSPPDHPLRDDVAESLAPYLNEVFAHIDLCASIISRLDITCGSGDQHADLKPLFTQNMVSDDVYADALNWSHGWVKTCLDKLLESGAPASVVRRDFREALLTYLRHHDRVDILRSFAGEPTHDQIEAERFSYYVRQMELVGVTDQADVYEAINDCLRASADRTTWAERGNVDASELQDFEKDLIRTWRNTRGQVLVEHSGKADEAKGELLLRKCLLHNTDLNGLSVPTHFVPGSFHTLANALDVGWHPDYRSIVKKMAKSDIHAGGEA